MAPVKIRLELPKPTAAQASVLGSTARYRVGVAGRRSGKTTLGSYALCVAAASGQPTLWTSPTYGMLSETWRLIRHWLAPATAWKSEQEHTLQLKTGGSVRCVSLDTPDVIRGGGYGFVVIDEAAMVPHLMDVWEMIVRPTLTDYQGRALFLSTPRGTGAFQTLYLRGMDPGLTEWAAFTFTSAANPHLPADELRQARSELPARVYAQEYEAEFCADDESAVFSGVRAAVEPGIECGHPRLGHRYVLGVDWGRIHDYTAIAVVDATIGACVKVQRVRHPDYARSLAEVEAVAARFHPRWIISESVGMGDPLTQDLYRSGIATVLPFKTTAVSKHDAVMALALALERRALTIPDDPTLIAELQAFQVHAGPSGLPKYGAPAGTHDDTVLALAFAHSAMRY